MAGVYIGAEETRNYGWYCSETQEQADRHLDSIAELLESSAIETYYPNLGERKIGKYGKPKAWRRNRLMAQNGFTIDAIGLDTAVRGARVKEDRPGLIIFDDIDGKHDSPKTIKKKIDIITTSVLPSGSNDMAVLCVQNLITPDSIFSQLADGRAEFLFDRIVSGPYPAVEGLAYEQKPEGGYRITAGAATWDGQNLQTCEDQINTWGLSAFLQEAQHEVDAPPGGMFDHLEYRHCNWSDVPDLVRTVVWVDPAVTSTDQSDSMGIQADGIAENDTIFRLWSWEQVTSPEDALKRAILKAIELKAEAVGIETDQGGDTWQSVYKQAWQSLVDDENYPHVTKRVSMPQFRSAKAGSGHGPKAHRASMMLPDYEQGRIVHVIGTHAVLERALNRFPLTKPYDLVDAGYWSWNDLKFLLEPASETIDDIDLNIYKSHRKRLTR